MTERPRSRRKVPAETIVEMGRLKGLSDGVVAFALTLLVLDIRVPAGLLAESVPEAIQNLAPAFAVYLLSFVVIGGAWGAHQRMLGQIERGDGLMVWWTLLFLLPITLLPASAALLGDHPGAALPTAVFALDIFGIEVAALLLWRHAGRQHLINPDLDPRVVASIGRRHVFAAVCFLVSIVLSLVVPPLVYLIWVVTFVLIFTTDWLSWQQAHRATTATIPLEDAARAHVHISHQTGTLDVAAGDSDTVLVEGSFGGGVTTRVSRDGDLIDATLTLPGRSALLNPRYPWAWGLLDLLDWNATLNAGVPIELDLDLAYGQATLHLEELQLESLTIRTSAGHLEIWLPSRAGVMKVGIQASAASIFLHVPDGIGLAIEQRAFGSSIEVATGEAPVVVTGRKYESSGYAGADQKVTLDVQIAAGSIHILGSGRDDAYGTQT